MYVVNIVFYLINRRTSWEDLVAYVNYPYQLIALTCTPLRALHQPSAISWLLTDNGINDLKVPLGILRKQRQV